MLRKKMPGMMALVCLTWVISIYPCASTEVACSLKKETGEGNVTHLILENQYLKMILVPEAGGICKSLVNKKTNKEMVASGNERAFWLLKEFVAGYDGDWEGREYECRILEQSGERISISLMRRGESGSLKWTTFKKTITLENGKSMVQVDYEFSNQYDSMAPVRVPLRFHHSAEIIGDNTTFYYPREKGIEVKPYNRKGANEEIWAYDATAGWIAGIGSESKSGFAFDFNSGYPYLMCIYSWLGSMSTVEWMFRTLEIKNGESLKYTMFLIPFSGLDGVTGVGGGIVAYIRTGKDVYASGEGAGGIPVEVALYSAEGKKVSVSVTWRKVGGTEKELSSQDLAVAPEAIGKIQCQTGGIEDGTYVITGVVKEQGKVISRFEKPVLIGKPSAEYKMAAAGKRLGGDNEKFVHGQPLLVKPSEGDFLSWTNPAVTPHIPWAKPYARGKVKALVLCDYQQGRDILELAQRIDLDFDTFTLHSMTSPHWASWWGYNGVPGIQAKLKDKLQNGRYEVIVLGGISGGLFTEEINKLLLERVKEGTGLVYVMPNTLTNTIWEVMPFAGEPEGFFQSEKKSGKWQKEKKHFITEGIPFSALPATMYMSYKAQGDVLATIGGAPLIAVKESPGMGRIVAFSYVNSCYAYVACALTPWVKYAPERFDYWEYYYGLLARSILWAAHKEPAVSLSKMEIAGIPEAGKKGEVGIMVEFNNPGAALAGAAEVTIRDAYSRKELGFTESIKIAGGTNIVKMTSKPCGLTGGMHLLDVIIRTKEGVVTWGTTDFKVESPVSIKEITIPDKVYGKGEKVPVKVVLEGKGKALLQADLVDGYGRLMDRLSREVDLETGKEISLEYALKEPVATVGYVKADLSREKETVWHAEKDFLMMPEEFAKRAWDDYELLVDWTGFINYNDYIVALRANEMRKTGVTAMLESVHPNAYYSVKNNQETGFRNGFKVGLVDLFNIQAKDYQENKRLYTKTGDKKYLQRNPSLEDPAYIEETKKRVESVTEIFKKYAPYGYCYNDEISLTSYVDAYDFDYSPCALKSFRTWLEKRYGTLEKLNKQWGTSFRAWDEVMPMTSEEVSKRGNAAPWADHREFMDISNARFYSTMREAIRQVDPGARCGLSGSQKPRAHNGYNYAELMGSFDFIQSYGGEGLDEIQHSFAAVKIAPWTGYGAPRRVLADRTWEQFLQGAAGMSYFVPRCMLNPDLTLYHDARDIVELTAPLRNGIGKLLLNAEKDRRVAIHYSQPSVRAAFLNNDTDRYDANRGGWAALVHDMGQQVVFLSSAEMAEGQLKQCDVLVLPLSVAISGEEANYIREFVKGGGLVIADGKTGLWDGHCTPYPQGILDDLFGIRRETVGDGSKSRGGTIAFQGDFKDCKLAGKSVYASTLEPNIRSTTGKNLGSLSDIPVMVVNEYGKGNAVYMNMPASGYESALARSGEKAMKEIMENVFALGKAKSRPVSVTSAGRAVLACEVARFKWKDLEYIGVMQRGVNPKFEPVQTELKFEKKAHLYDMLKGTYVGYADHAPTQMIPAEGQVFALLPYKVEKVKVGTKSVMSAGETVNYEIGIGVSPEGKAGRHVVRVNVYGPDGTLRPYYGDKLLADGGVFQSSFTLALNDPKGDWKIEAVDIASGVTGTATFTLKESAP